jgi:hypothetical protein
MNFEAGVLGFQMGRGLPWVRRDPGMGLAAGV